MTLKHEKGAPASKGGQFKANDRSDAPDSLSDNVFPEYIRDGYTTRERREVVGLNEGDRIDLTEHFLSDARSSGVTDPLLLSQAGTARVLALRGIDDDGGDPVLLADVQRSDGAKTSVLFQVHDEVYVITDDEGTDVTDEVHPHDISAGDRVDMTRLVDEYLSDPQRGGEESASSVVDLMNTRRTYEVVSAEFESDDHDDVVLLLRNPDDPDETFDWVVNGEHDTMTVVSRK